MEKVIYLLSRPDGAPSAGFAERLVGEVGPNLVAAGARGVQVNVVDEAVEPAAGLRIVATPPPPDAFVSVWVDSAVPLLRGPVDAVVLGAGEHVLAYLVTESEPIVPGGSTGADGRTDGFAQVAMLQRPPRLGEEEWLRLWLEHHTPVAVETQATFGYTQNVVTRALLGDGHHDAVVEELFPAAAMTDQHAFYDAAGDDEKLARRQAAMLASVDRFIDLDKIDVIPTSRYVIRPVA